MERAMTPKVMTPKGATRAAPALLTRALRRGGIDRAVGYTLVGRLWTAVAGFLTLFLLTRFLTPIEQGFYYTFNSVLALQVFFELGLTFVILQFASHERAQLEWTPARTLTGDPRAKARLASLLRISLVWYAVMAALMMATLLPAGLEFFGAHAPAHAAVRWQWPWAWVVLVSGGMLAASPLYAVLEGCGLVAEVAARQLVQNVLTSLLLWLALSRHWALFAAPCSTTISLLYGLFWLWRNYRPFARDLLGSALPDVAISWRREVWPFQWKIGLSWLSGYFISSLFNPILFKYHGAVAAGQMGLSFSVMGAVAAIAMAWVTTKSAPFGSLIARREFRQLDRLFFPTLWQSASVVAVGGLGFWGAAWLLHHWHHPLALRLLPLQPLGLLIGAVVINHVVFAQALYLRAHKQEPFLILSVVIGVLVALSSYLLGRPLGAVGMMLGYFVVNATVGLGAGTAIFLWKRRAWHAPAEAA